MDSANFDHAVVTQGAISLRGGSGIVIQDQHKSVLHSYIKISVTLLALILLQSAFIYL